PKGEFAAICAASARLSGSSASRSTTRLTSPMRCASSASTNRPVYMISAAMPGLTSRGSSQEIPRSPALMPMRTIAALKRVAGVGEDDDAQVGIVAQVDRELLELVEHPDGHRVEPGWAVERDEQDARLGPAQGQGALSGHGRTPHAAPRTARPRAARTARRPS